VHPQEKFVGEAEPFCLAWQSTKDDETVPCCRSRSDCTRLEISERFGRPPFPPLAACGGEGGIAVVEPAANYDHPRGSPGRHQSLQCLALRRRYLAIFFAAREAGFVQVFGLSTRSGGRRPKSAKARNRGGWDTAVPRALWGIERGAGLKENDAKRLSPWLWPKAWVSLPATIPAGLPTRRNGSHPHLFKQIVFRP
jgi:hypothetical protein